MIVVGGGTAGAVFSPGCSRRRPHQTVLLLEAGPDYGPFSGGAWPADLTDGSSLCHSHQWGYDSGNQYQARTIPFSRARVIGAAARRTMAARRSGASRRLRCLGCLGKSRLVERKRSFTSLHHRFRAAFGSHSRGSDQVQPFQRIFLDAAPLAGIPLVENLNDLDEPAGVAPSLANNCDGVRGTRHLPISILFDRARTCASWVIPWSTGSSSDGTRATGVQAIHNGFEEYYGADRVVLAAGA